jgi:hypothetical protein
MFGCALPVTLGYQKISSRHLPFVIAQLLQYLRSKGVNAIISLS